MRTSNSERGAATGGLETQDVKDTVATFRQRGLTVSEPGALSALTSGILANINDPVYGRIELADSRRVARCEKAGRLEVTRGGGVI